ncbi:hypothetical protein BDV95DRAFT_598345 [Massariosphaeria phaeospora]|uniref:Uncharacterized protein n=1 Tax=Massariosphaeria phaeospora TaxID=100035 RepID=A0A7C8I4U1_9PLEO|nr:hypothetical protein BDV95DRAFT_598345 [Massariosphaeria phaeospora]
MASGYPRAGPSRWAQEPITLSDSEDAMDSEDIMSTSDEGSMSEELMSKEANDRRIRQAITYLASKGGSDAPYTYEDRVEKIKQYIIHQYPEDGCAFDPNLFRQLKTMVREEQEQLDLEDTDRETLDPIEALYRGDYRPLTPITPELPPLQPRAPVRHRSLSTSKAPSKQAEAREMEWLYGGPKNGKEEWHKDFPPSLPFGETLYMQEWESMMINYDLAESAKKTADDKDPLVQTDVPYDAVKKSGRFSKGPYDSGSRFKLPEIEDGDWHTVNNAIVRLANLEDYVETHNTANHVQETGKDYAPRIFLPKVIMTPQNHGYETSTPRRSQSAASQSSAKRGYSIPPPTRRPSTPKATAGPSKATAGPSTAPRPSSSKYGTINPDVRPAEYRKPSQSTDKGKGKAPMRTPSASSSIRIPPVLVDGETGEPVVRHLSHIPAHHTTVKPKANVAAASAPPPPTTTIAPAGKRGPGRPKGSGKRKLSTADYEGPLARAKQAKTFNNTPAKKALGKKAKTVGFRNPSVTAAGFETVKRGTTRSGTKFR